MSLGSSPVFAASCPLTAGNTALWNGFCIRVPSRSRKMTVRIAIPLQPFTAPMRSPCMKYFWKAKKKMIIGIAASAAPDISRP